MEEVSYRNKSHSAGGAKVDIELLYLVTAAKLQEIPMHPRITQFS
jgi:hypothetical protein